MPNAEIRQVVSRVTNRRRIISIIAAAAFLLAILCSMAYIAAEADHDCDGDGCAICAQISICRNTLKNLMTAVCAAVFAAAFIYILCRSASVCTYSVQFSSLVSLKVKLSD